MNWLKLIFLKVISSDNKFHLADEFKEENEDCSIEENDKTSSAR